MTSPFAQPSTAGQGDNFNPTELNGHLLLIYPGATKMVMTQSYGEKEAVTAEIHVLDVVDQSTGHPPVLTNTLIFNAVLIGQLKTEGTKGGMVLGRLGQGANTKGNAPWLLFDYTPQDEQVARTYIATHPREQFTQPQAQQAPAPAPTQWGPAPAAAPQPDLWAGVAASPAPAAQAAPAGPPQGQWGAAPAATPAAPQPGGAPAQWQNSGQQPSPQGVPSNGAATAVPAAAAPGSPAPQWGAPAASAQAAPAPTAPVSPSVALDPGLVAFLQGKGVNPEGMTAEQATMIANTLQAQQPPPF